MRDASQIHELKEILHAMDQLPKSVYSPSDDSHLMLGAIAQIPVEGKKVVDIGTGSGILGLFCAMRGGRVTATDVDATALGCARRTAERLGTTIEFALSDMFSNVHGKFDLVLFNPPYVPSTTVEDRTVDGGPGGLTFMKRFLKELPAHLNRDGVGLCLVSSINEPESLRAEYPQLDFAVVASCGMFFEVLQVLRVRSRDDLAS